MSNSVLIFPVNAEPEVEGPFVPPVTSSFYLQKPSPKRKTGQAGLNKRCVNRVRKNRLRNRIASASRRANRK